MGTIRIDDLPDDVHAILKRRAEVAGVSLEHYLRDMLTRLARRPTHDELQRRIAERGSGPSTETIVAAVRHIRAHGE